MEDNPVFIGDVNEFSNSIKKRREDQKKNRQYISFPLLLKPKYCGRTTDPITNKEYAKYTLETLDELKIPYNIIQLDFGDYHLGVTLDDGSMLIIIIERKTVSDLIKSFTSFEGSGKNRLDEQLDECLKKSKEYYKNSKVILLIEDFYDHMYILDDSTKMKGIWSRFKMNPSNKIDDEGRPRFTTCMYAKHSYMNPLSLLEKIRAIEQKGIEVWRMGGAQHTYDRIIKILLENFKKKRTRVKSIRRKPRVMDIKRQKQFIMEGFENIGGSISLDLIEKYDRLIDLFNAIVSAKSHGEIGIKRFGKTKFDYLKKILTTKNDEKIEEENIEFVFDE